MHWDLAPKIRIDLVCYGGINFSGERKVVDVHAVGGRQGPDIGPEDIKSLAIIAAEGTRVILSVEPDGALTSTWRCIRIVKGKYSKNRDGHPLVRIPDLDWLDKADARRTDSEFQECYEQVGSLEEGSAWTFGQAGDRPLKGHVLSIRVDRG